MLYTRHPTHSYTRLLEPGSLIQDGRKPFWLRRGEAFWCGHRVVDGDDAAETVEQGAEAGVSRVVFSSETA